MRYLSWHAVWTAFFGLAYIAWNIDLWKNGLGRELFQIMEAANKEESTSSSLPEDAGFIYLPARIPKPPSLEIIKSFTFERFEKYMTAPAGEEHYALLFYLTNTYGDERPVVDIGTRFAASALALAAGGSPVFTFDLPESSERQHAFRGRSEFGWHAMVQKQGIHIRFFNENLLERPEIPDVIKNTWLMLLDTHHYPYSNPFEREWVARLCDAGYKGLLLLDDIHLNPEMKEWWEEVQRLQETRGYRAFDITHVGHKSGTGILDFSGRLKVEFPPTLLA